jgi:hypothetical protein
MAFIHNSGNWLTSSLRGAAWVSAAQGIVQQVQGINIGSRHRVGTMRTQVDLKAARGGVVREGAASIRTEELQGEVISIACNSGGQHALMITHIHGVGEQNHPTISMTIQ